MRFEEALKIMAIGIRPKGYMVSFYHAEGRFLRSDHFPDKNAGERLIASAEHAQALAVAFAQKTVGKCVDIVVTDDQFQAVPGALRLNRRA